MRDAVHNTVMDCHVIPLRFINRKEGLLTLVEELKDIPFRMRRIYYIHNVPDNAMRGHHAHKKLHQLMIAVSGCFHVELHDGSMNRWVWLDNANEGLLIVPGIWRELSDFSKDAVCLVIASQRYNENDYIRDYNEFLKFKQ